MFQFPFKRRDPDCDAHRFPDGEPPFESINGSLSVAAEKFRTSLAKRARELEGGKSSLAAAIENLRPSAFARMVPLELEQGAKDFLLAVLASCPRNRFLMRALLTRFAREHEDLKDFIDIWHSTDKPTPSLGLFTRDRPSFTALSRTLDILRDLSRIKGTPQTEAIFRPLLWDWFDVYKLRKVRRDAVATANDRTLIALGKFLRDMQDARPLVAAKLVDFFFRRQALVFCVTGDVSTDSPQNWIALQRLAKSESPELIDSLLNALVEPAALHKKVWSSHSLVELVTHGARIFKESWTALKGRQTPEFPLRYSDLEPWIHAAHSGSLIDYPAKFDREIANALLRSKGDVGRSRLERVVQRSGGDNPPAGLNTPEGRQMFHETLEMMTRDKDAQFGFSSLTFGCRSIPGSALGPQLPWQLYRFGQEAFGNVAMLNSFTPTVFPGRGVLLSRPQLHRVFERNPNSSDPFGMWQELLPWAYNEFNDFEGSSFCLFRGCQAVIPPRTEKFRISESVWPPTHYAYLWYNDHFLPYDTVGSLLVPIDVLEGVLACMGAEVKLTEEGKRVQSLIRSGSVPLGMDPITLKMLADSINMTVIYSGSGSCLGGALCNAIPPHVDPLFSWERALYERTRDSWGHTHKYFLTSDAYSELFWPMQRAHYELYEVWGALQRINDLFRHSLARYRSGGTGEDPSLNLARISPLVEAYRWFHGGHAAGWKEDDFPVIVAADPNYYQRLGGPPFMIDTHALTVHSGEEIRRLPQDGSGSEFTESFIFGTLWETFAGTLVDFRPMHRKDVFR